jgi:tungstate transport system ATP-binding protein
MSAAETSPTGTTAAGQAFPPTAGGAFGDTILPCRFEETVYEIAGKRLIDGLDLEIEAGPRTLILGPNGAGKSLTLRLAHGLIRPTSGRILWQNRKLDGAGRGPRRQAMVFQKPVLLRRSVAANLDYALSVHKVRGPERTRRRDEALERTGLTAYARQPARTLSGGEQQRLAMARAWALRPQVLFLDEPTASLDPAASHAIEEIVQAMHAEGCKIVMTTHDLGQARRLADEVVFLNRGRVVERQAAERFFERPESQPARDFLAGKLVW